MSLFQQDLNNEQILAKHLDKVYKELNISFTRINDINLQHEGVDIIVTKKGSKLHVDEKAQLHYINKTLPTFTFEISYIKDGNLKTGWFLDKSKKTEYYFLITGIFSISGDNITKGIKSCIITVVNRISLIELLEKRGLTQSRMEFYEKKIRTNPNFEFKTSITELNSQTEGCIVYSNQLQEKPINLMLKLKFMIQQGVAKQIYP